MSEETLITHVIVIDTDTADGLAATVEMSLEGKITIADGCVVILLPGSFCTICQVGIGDVGAYLKVLARV